LNRTVEDDKKTVKILLLGAGECGKSTILKQMKILHLNGFSEAETREYKILCRRNALDAMKQLAGACHSLNIPFKNSANEKLSREFVKIQSIDTTLKHKDMIRQLWADEAVHHAKERENEFHLLDSCGYFMENLDRIFSEDFEPTQQDILRTRLMTTGIIETQFTKENMLFKVYDVGGQRGERKKWIHAFDDVNAIMFIASLSEYDQVLAEDRSRNRLIESLELFEGIVNMPWFESAAIILFLNKNDLFQVKIQKVDIGKYHSEYVHPPAVNQETGEALNAEELVQQKYECGLEFIRESYFDMNDNDEKSVYCHVTDATNTSNIAFVWHTARHSILSTKITSSGLAMC